MEVSMLQSQSHIYNEGGDQYRCFYSFRFMKVTVLFFQRCFPQKRLKFVVVCKGNGSQWVLQNSNILDREEVIWCFYQLVDLEDIFHSDSACDKLFTIFLWVTGLWGLFLSLFVARLLAEYEIVMWQQLVL